MKPLLALLAIVVVGSVLFVTLRSGERAPGDGARPGAHDVESPAPGARAPDPMRPAGTPGAPGGPGASAAREALPSAPERFGTWTADGEGWIEGRVVFPGSTPPDETLRVLALARELTPRELHGSSGLLRALHEGDGDPDGLLATEPVAPDGSFRIPFPAGREVGWLALDGRHLYLQRVEEVRPGTDAAAVLEPVLGGRVLGTVLLPEGFGPETFADCVARLGVDTDNIGFSALDANWSFSRHAGVGPDGGFELRALTPSRISQLRVACELLANFDRSGLEVQGGRDLVLEALLELGGTIRGIVVDSRGAPIAGAEVDAVDAFLFGFPAGESAETESRDDGTFELQGVPAGNPKLMAQAAGYLFGDAVPVDVIPGGVVDGIRLVIDDGASIDGRVTYSDGTPAPGARVLVSFDPEAMMGMAALNAGRGATGDATADGEGRFTVVGLGGGPFEVRALADPPEGAPTSPAGASDAEARLFRWSQVVSGVAPGTRDLQLVLEPPSIVTGRVVDTAGAPVPRFQARLRTKGSGALVRPESQHPEMPADRRELGFEDANGEFALAGLRRGDWVLEVHAEGFAPSAPNELALPGDAVLPLTVVLEPAAAIAGSVVTPDGTPIPGAQVTLQADSSQSMASMAGELELPETYTEEDGAFLLSGLGTGVQSVVAAHPDYATSTVVPVETVSGETTTGVVVPLRDGGSIAGVVFAEDGAPESGARIVIQNSATFGTIITRTAGDGTFRAERLTPGGWTVSAFLDEGGMTASGGDGAADMTDFLSNLKFQIVEVVDGEEVWVELGAPPEDPVRVTGTITHAGRPVGPGILSFTQEGQVGLEGMRMAPFDAAGEFSTELDGSGRYHLQVQVLGDSATQQQTIEYTHEIPDQEEVRVDLALPGGRISGTVYGPEGDAAAGARVSLITEGGVTTGTFMGGQYSEVVTAEDGFYEFSFLRPGIYSVAAGGTPFGGAFGTTTSNGRTLHDGLRLGEGENLAGIDFRLKRAGDIVGTVRDATGSIVANAAIFVRDEGGRLLERFSMNATGPDGSFSYSGVAPGEYSVVARAWGLASDESQRVVVREGKTTSVDVVVDPGTTLVLTVVDQTGKDVEARISVLDAAGREMNGMFGFNEMMTRMSEGFHMDQQRVGPLPAGKYTVIVEASDGRRARKPVTIDGREERKLKIRLR